MTKKHLTDEQKQLLSLLDKKWKYIAKDRDGEVNVFSFCPYKNDYCFYDNDDECCDICADLFPEDMFDYLSWEYEEASFIENLLK